MVRGAQFRTGSIRRTVPLPVTVGEEIGALRGWAGNGAGAGASATQDEERPSPGRLGEGRVVCFRGGGAEKEWAANGAPTE